MLDPNSITPHLTTEGFTRAKQKLQESHDLIVKLEDKGIKRPAIAQLPIGLTADNRLFMPIYDHEMHAVGAVEILNLNTIVSHFNIESGGLVGHYSLNLTDSPLYVVSTIMELFFLWQEGYDNVVLFPDLEKIPHPVFRKYKKIILLHYNRELAMKLRRKVFCCYLEEEYKDGELPMEKLIVNELGNTFTSNPFILNNKLTFLFGGNYLYAVNQDEDIKVTYKQNSRQLHHDGVHYNITAHSIKYNFKREETTLGDAYDTLYSYLYDNLYFCTGDQVMVLTYYIMSCYISPYFLASFDLQVILNNQMWKNIFRMVMNEVMPDSNNSHSGSCVLTRPDDIDRDIPVLRTSLITNENGKSITGIPIVLDICTGSNNDLRRMDGLRRPGVKNKLINWSLGYEPGIYKGTKGQQKESWKNQFGMIVKNSQSISHIEDVIKQSQEVIKKLKLDKYNYSLIY